MMQWFKMLFSGNSGTAQIAKERLKVIVAHERVKNSGADFLPMLQKEITEVIAKYVQIGPDEVKVEFEQHGDRSVLELNITLPENFVEKAKHADNPKSSHAG